MGRKLFVGNLPFSTDERELEELFQSVAPVDTVNIVRDQMTGRARGFAFVEMQTDEGASAAIGHYVRQHSRRLNIQRLPLPS